ncbi:MAG: phosphoribosylformylglycinamidine synthase subunit PurSL, partial [Chloroflexota bacterium]|nr:phosphoribosylformylglycinamidine synthase subunit PurSL [Chloroflexota bacterium]
AQGCHDAAVAYEAPFISGKDSLNNEYTGADGKKHAIPGTLLISALGIVPDVARTVTMSLKAAGDRLYIVGGNLPSPTFPPLAGVGSALALYRALHAAMRAGLVRACHDCSEGGLAVAAAEMVIGGGLGLALRLADAPRSPDLDRDEALLFSESLGRLLVEVAPEHAAEFAARLAGLPCAAIGEVIAEPCLCVIGLAGAPVIEAELAALEQAWRGHIR